MSEARIIRGIGGFYTLLTEDGRELECKARGRFRATGDTPLVGDIVRYEEQKNGYTLITELLSRKNSLVRPAVANIDNIAIVLSASAPAPDWLLIDKLLIDAIRKNIVPILILNKCDIADPTILCEFRTDYSAHFSVFEVSAVNGSGIDRLIKAISGTVTCFCGQSAVGKSSLINAMIPGLDLETGGLSRKTERGRHTTRKAELWPAFGGAILDTPGFSLFDAELLEQNELNACYPEFSGYYERCRFPSCMHISEPGCRVHDAIKEGGMSKARYDRYCLLAKEFEFRRKHKYD